MNTAGYFLIGHSRFLFHFLILFSIFLKKLQDFTGYNFLINFKD